MEPVPGLDPATWDLVMENLVEGKYSLLLGAGASRGSVNALGEALPSGNGLADELRVKYKIPAPPPGTTTPLRTIYDLCERIAKRETLEMPSTYLRRRFAGCSVPAWYADLVRARWRIIFNLNIDDVVPSAYRTFQEQARQRLRLASWDEPEVFHREAADSVTCVQLHGAAAGGSLIFGSLDYLGSVSQGGAAHRLFWDSWPRLPVIVVGASLTDELDMAAPLAEERIAAEDQPPSLVILPSFTDFDRFRLEAAELTPVAMTGERFMAAVARDWTSAVRRLDARGASETGDINPNRAYFLQHFKTLRRRDDRHDFFAGDEPTYADIKNNRDAPRELPALTGGPMSVMPDNAVSIVAFAGQLSGTTTAELRFLASCEDAGFHCYEYDSDASFSGAAVLAAFRNDALLLVRIPDLDDFPEALHELCDQAEKAGISVRIVTAVRPSRLTALSTSATTTALRPVAVPEHLRDSEIRALLAVLESHRRLNTLRPKTEEERFNFVKVEHGASIYDALSAASGGRGFEQRISSIHEAIARTGDAEVAAMSVIAAELGYPLPDAAVARACNRTVVSLHHAIQSDPLSTLVRSERGLLASRQRSTTRRLASRLVAPATRFDLTQRLAIALAPYITRHTIRQRTRPHRIIAQLMDAERVIAWFGAESAETWYHGLEPPYGWNARFWEQRALAACEHPEPRYEAAEAWAREAVASHADPFSLNTLGTVRLRRALAYGFDPDLFYSGLEDVGGAAALLTRPSEHPYVTALSYLRRAYRVAGASERPRLITAFNRWMDDARHSAMWQVPSSRESVEKQMEEFLRAVAV